MAFLDCGGDRELNKLSVVCGCVLEHTPPLPPEMAPNYQTPQALRVLRSLLESFHKFPIMAVKEGCSEEFERERHASEYASNSNPRHPHNDYHHHHHHHNNTPSSEVDSKKNSGWKERENSKVSGADYTTGSAGSTVTPSISSINVDSNREESKPKKKAKRERGEEDEEGEAVGTPSTPVKAVSLLLAKMRRLFSGDPSVL